MTSFAAHLARHGPDSRRAPMRLAEARAYCRRLARSQYENFTVASLWLPRELLPHFYAVYAYCRWADNLADEVGGGARALTLLRWWRGELLRCYEGRARHPVFIALRETVRQFSIPQRPFLDLLWAFEQDQLVARYQTYDQLLNYCKYSANPVGRLVLYLCRSFSPERAVLADHVCTALQLTNHWQDVSRDLDIGRVYLPVEDCRRFGYGDAALHGRQYTQEFVELMAELVGRARELFYRGWPLVSQMPEAVRPDLELFIRGGLAVLRKIEWRRYDVWRSRPKLAPWEKAWLVARTVFGHVVQAVA